MSDNNNDNSEADQYGASLWARIEALSALGRPREALAELHLALAESPDDPDLLFETASAYARIGDTNQAFAFANRVVAAAPNWAEAYRLRAVLFLSQRGTMFHFSALADARRAVAADPQDAGSWGILTESLLAAREKKQALEAARQVAALAPGSAYAHLILAKTAGKTGDWSLSAEHARRALALDAEDEYAQNLLGDALLHSGQAGEGARLLLQAVTRQPDDPDVREQFRRTIGAYLNLGLTSEHLRIAGAAVWMATFVLFLVAETWFAGPLARWIFGPLFLLGAAGVLRERRRRWQCLPPEVQAAYRLSSPWREFWKEVPRF